MTRVIAVDLGATSVRVAEVDVDDPGREPVILHRVVNRSVRDAAGTLRWDWPRLMDAIRTGIASARARPSTESIASIGVDTWGVDYGLIDEHGRLISAPISYRDERTAGWRTISESIGSFELFSRTGLEPASINTMFQLAAHDRGELARARHLLMLPELVIHELTGALLAERTSAGTTGLIDLSTGQWSADLLDGAGIALEPWQFPTVGSAGATAGAIDGIPVTVVNGHDTSSAIAGLPEPTRPRAFVSSGSWLIVGAETPHPVVTEAAFRSGLTNEPGPRGNVLARNLPGFVIIERLLAAWGGPDLGSLMDEASAHRWHGDPPTIDALAAAGNDADLLALLGRASGRRETSQADLLQVALATLARGAAQAVRVLGEASGIHFAEIALMGGGLRAGLYLELLEQETGLPVVAGVAESAALGNALVQARAHGLIGQ